MQGNSFAIRRIGVRRVKDTLWPGNLGPENTLTRRASFDVALFSGPRAMPGADLWLPLRGEYTRSARVSRPRRLARQTGLPRSSQNSVSEVFVLAKLTPNEGDLSVKHLGGVRRPAPSAGSCLGAGSGETRAQRGFVLGGGVRRPAPSAGSCLVVRFTNNVAVTADF